MMVKMSKPTVEEWVEWARNNNTDLPTIKWVQDNPRVFNEFYQPRSSTHERYQHRVPELHTTNKQGHRHA